MRTAYIIQTMQTYGEWLDSSKPFYNLEAAKLAAAEEANIYFCPKRVVTVKTQKVVYTIGDTPEYHAYMAKVRAIIEARANPSERFNMPTANEIRVTLSANLNHPFWWDMCDAISEGTSRAMAREEYELTTSDLAGTFLMGEEL